MIYLPYRQSISMKKKRSSIQFFTMLSLVFVTILLTSCNKCDDPLNRVAGDVIEESVVKTLTNPPSAPMLIRSAEDFGGQQIRISLNNGYSFEQIDYDQYSVVCFPTQTSCDASFDKEVTIDAVNKIVKYRMGITVCDLCEYEVSQAHFLLIQRIPEDYSFEYELQQLN